MVRDDWADLFTFVLFISCFFLLCFSFGIFYMERSRMWLGVQLILFVINVYQGMYGDKLLYDWFDDMRNESKFIVWRIVSDAELNKVLVLFSKAHNFPLLMAFLHVIFFFCFIFWFWFVFFFSLLFNNFSLFYFMNKYEFFFCLKKVTKTFFFILVAHKFRCLCYFPLVFTSIHL